MLVIEAMHGHHDCMELQQMRYAVAVAEERSFTKAAERCFVVQSVVAALPVSHRLARRKRLKLADLAGEAFVDFPSGSAGRAQGDLAFQAAGLHREVAFEAMTTDLMVGLIRNELAVGMLSADVVPHDSGVLVVPLVDGPRRIEYLAWNEFNPSPATRAFLDAIPHDHADAATDSSDTPAL